MSFEEIVKQVMSLYPHLPFIETKEEAWDRYSKTEPDENLVFLASNYLVRSYFVLQPMKRTQEQKEELAAFQDDLKYFKTEIIKRMDRGRFAMSFRGLLFVFEIDCSEDRLDDRLQIHCMRLAMTDQEGSL